MVDLGPIRLPRATRRFIRMYPKRMQEPTLNSIAYAEEIGLITYRESHQLWVLAQLFNPDLVQASAKSV